LASTARRVAAAKEAAPLAMLISDTEPQRTRRSLAGALRSSGMSLVAEVKGASPSRGTIRADYEPVEIALAYERAGAAALSVLTEPEFFGADLPRLGKIRDRVQLPLLRKDFIIDEYQLYESVRYGADAILLIVGAVSDGELGILVEKARTMGLQVLLEATNAGQLAVALATEADIIGINNRDLRTLQIDTSNSLRLAEQAKRDLGGRPLIAESGIETRQDVQALEDAGFDAILVGTALMSSDDIEGKIMDLLATT